MSAKEEGKAYDHGASIAGTSQQPSRETEHRDTARGNEGERNELTPERRKEGVAPGPTTHDDTRISRKGE